MSRPFLRKKCAIWLLPFALFSIATLPSNAAESKKIPLRIIVVNSASEAKDVLEKLKKGVPFTVLAEERSRYKSGGKSGDPGVIDFSHLEPALKRAVTKMKEGDISGAIRLRKNRYAIVQVMDFSRYRKGAAAFRAGDFVSAETDLAEHLRQNPDAAKARIMLGEIYERNRDFDKAEAVYKELISRDCKSWIAYDRLGKLYMRNAEYPMAKDIYAKGLRYIPDAEGFRTGMREAEAHLAGASLPGAAPEIHAASQTKVETKPPMKAPPKPPPAVPQSDKDGGSMHLRMIVLETKSEAVEILSDLKKGKSFALLAKEKSIDERSRGEFGYLGEVKVGSLDAPIQDVVRDMKTGQISAIVKLGEERYAIMQSADFHYFIEGEKAFIREDFKTAEKKLLKHLSLNEDDAAAYLMLGTIYEEWNDYQKAEEMFRTGISFHPKVVLLYLRLGKLYQAQRQFQKSKDVFAEGFMNIPSSEQLAKAIEMVDILLYSESRKK